MTLAISNNSIYQYSNIYGIQVKISSGSPTINATITGNTIANPGTFGGAALSVLAGAASGDGGTLCVDIGGAGALANNIAAGANPSGDTDFKIRERFNTTLNIPGAPATDTTSIKNYIIGRNSPVSAPTGTVTDDAGGGTFTNSGTSCAGPMTVMNLFGAGKHNLFAQTKTTLKNEEGTATVTPRVASLAPERGQNERWRTPVRPRPSEREAVQSAVTHTQVSSTAAQGAPGKRAEQLAKRYPAAFSRPVYLSGPNRFEPGLKAKGRAGITSSPLVPPAGVNVTVGTLPQNKTLTIKFQVTINNPPGANQVSNQGTVSGSNFSNVLTDDPAVGGAADPTVTPVDTTITWTGTTDVVWETGTNWSTGQAPVPVNDVVIPNVANQPTLAASDPTVNSVNLNASATLTITGHALTIAGSTNSNLTVDGTVSGGGVQFGSGTHTFSGAGSLSSTNTVTVLSGSTVNEGSNLQLGALTINSGGAFVTSNKTLSLTGNLTNNGTFTTTGGSVILNGSSAQTVTGVTTFNNLTVNNANGVTLSNSDTVGGLLTLTSGVLGVGTTTLTLNGDVTTSAGSISSGTAGTVNYTQSSNGQHVAPGTYGNVTFSNFTKTLPSGTVKIAGTFTTGAAGGHTVSGSTVEFNGSSLQTLPSTFTTYNNLTINNPAGVNGFSGLIVQGLLEVKTGTFTSSTTFNSVQIDSGATLAGTNATTMNVSGNWTNNGTFTANGNTVNFNGTGAQSIGGSSPTTFNNLTINNSNAAGVTLNTSETVNGTLTLTLGNITTGANTLALGAGATINRTSGQIIGNLKKTFAANGSFTYPVGTANGYSPVDATVTSGTGDLTVVAVQAAQPLLASAKSLQRYWTLTQGAGGSLVTNLVFHYIQGDVPGTSTESNYRIIRVSGGTAQNFPNNCASGSPCVDTTANTGTINSVGNFSDWTLGEPASPTASCSYALSPSSGAFPVGGGSGNFLVQVQDTCEWTATTAQSWIGLNASSSGTGTGAVSFTVGPNPSPSARSGQITVADRAYTVTQAGTCSFALSGVTARVFTPLGGSGQAQVQATAGCSWQATTSASFISLFPTGGAGNGTLDYQVLPNSNATPNKGQVSVGDQSFLLRQGAKFNDVPSSHPFFDPISRISAYEITGGCGDGNYCPDGTVNRAQMAIFLLRAKYGSSYVPPPATGTMFGDVSAGAFAAAWIEQLARDGITSGCGGGNYCPEAAVQRGVMAVFLVRAFGW